MGGSMRRFYAIPMAVMLTLLFISSSALSQPEVEEGEYWIYYSEVDDQSEMGTSTCIGHNRDAPFTGIGVTSGAVYSYYSFYDNNLLGWTTIGTSVLCYAEAVVTSANSWAIESSDYEYLGGGPYVFWSIHIQRGESSLEPWYDSSYYKLTIWR